MQLTSAQIQLAGMVAAGAPIEPVACSSPVVMDATARATAYLIYVWVRGIHTMLWRRFLVHAESTLADIILVVEAVSNRARAASTIC